MSSSTASEGRAGDRRGKREILQIALGGGGGGGGGEDCAFGRGTVRGIDTC
jgi:hypothetical protein